MNGHTIGFLPQTQKLELHTKQIIVKVILKRFHFNILKVARLDVLGGYLPNLSINYIAMSKDMETVSCQFLKTIPVNNVDAHL